MTVTVFIYTTLIQCIYKVILNIVTELWQETSGN